MISFDQIRSALLDSEPNGALDRLVLEEQARGRKTIQIYDDLLGHIPAIRALPEYAEDWEDALGDTLDALRGWVHPSCAYTDPESAPSTSAATRSAPLPTPEQLPGQTTP
jgi:hypothetical protein